MTSPLPDSIFTMNGWCTKEKASRLYDLVLSAKPATVVELGVFAGRSFIPMALGLKHNQQGTITGVDPWAKTASTENYDPNDPNFIWWNSLDHEMILNCFKDSLKHYDVELFSSYIRSTSSEALQSFADGSIDILHQDGNHSEETSCKEIDMYAPKLRVDGYWIMDDTDWESTSKAQKLIIKKGFILLEDHTSWRIYKKIK